MKIEYDPERDLMYIWFRTQGEQAAATVTISPGVHADLDAQGKLIGIELLDASHVIGRRFAFEFNLPQTMIPAAGAA